MSYRRIVAEYVIILSLLFFCVLRVVSIVLTPKYLETANDITSKKISIYNVRGTIYDCNINRLTNNIQRYAVLITDDPKAISSISEYFTGDETIKIINEIRSSRFSVRIVEKEIVGEGLVCLPFNSRISNESLAKHIIGYLDDKNNGVSGLEGAFNELLYSDRQISLNMNVDGQGGILLGSVEIKDDSISDGVVTTIDANIQKIVETAADSLVCGAVVVVDATNGKIRAITSRPDFNPENLGDYINDENSPLINRALLNFNVGSVFKPCVAAAALEANYQYYNYNCVGASDIDGLSFRCHNLSGHGNIGLKDAIKYSCNTYFYNLAISLGADKIYALAEKAGFNSSICLCDGLNSAKGNIGNLNEISLSNRALSNLAIGQGELMLSPVAITTLYCAIANKGEYYTPTIYEGEFKNNKLIKNEVKSTAVRLMNEEVANTLKIYLKGVLEQDGTGYLANPNIISAAGKTATAQTGIINNGKSVTNTWFCGFFPFENPKYVVTVLSENSETSCAGVFAEIANKMYAQ